MCGWSSSGLGKSRGFEMMEVLMVNHGGGRYDTIVTVEKKQQKISNMKILKKQNLAGDNKHYYYQFKGKELVLPVDEFNAKNENFAINSAILFKAKLLYSDWFIHFKNCINYPNYRQRVGLYEGSFIRLKNSIAESLNALNTQNVLKYNAIMLSEEVIPLMLTGTFKASVLEKDLQKFLIQVRTLYNFEDEKTYKKLFNTSKKTAQFVEVGG